MKNFILIRIFMVFIAAMSLHNNLLAANGDMTKIDSWYDDEDIRAMVKEHLGNSIYIAPAIPDWPELMNDTVSLAIAEVRSGRIALIPININNSHWTALAVRGRSNGSIVALHNDSLGHPISYSNMSGKYIEALRQLVPDIEIIDLQVHQQDDGFSCGLFTAKNLIAFANLKEEESTDKAAREVLEKIREQVQYENEVNHAK